MQKIINGIAIFSGVVALSVVGLGGYVFIRKDAIIDGVKEKVMDAVMPDICLLYTSPSPRDVSTSRMPSSA